MNDVDLSGDWSGIFNYPTDLPATAFLAHLVDESGEISGTVDEPNAWEDGPDVLDAVLDGVREGWNVRFVKYYDDSDGAYDAVNYEGQIADSGNEISGTWDIPGEWSGTFIMTRQTGVGTLIENEATESVNSSQTVIP